MCVCLCCVCRLHSFSMQIADASLQGDQRASAVEFCSCPAGYAGTSCEVYALDALQYMSRPLCTVSNCFCVFQSCIPGFRRVNGNLYNGVCEACHCHGHASQCDEVTGHCLVGDCSNHQRTHTAVDLNCKMKFWRCAAD